MRELGLVALVVAIALAVVAGAVFGIGDASVMVSPPEAVAEEFVRELATRRYDLARQRVAESARGRATEGALRQTFEPVRVHTGKINTVDATPSPSPFGDSGEALARADVHGDRGTASLTIALSREKGLWAVSDWTLTAAHAGSHR